MTSYAPTVPGIPLYVRGRHRPLRADVLSPPSAIAIRSQHLTNREVLQRTLRRLHPSYRDMEVDSRGLEAGMPKQDLDGAEVGSCIQQMGGERVSPNVGARLFFNAGLLGQLLADLPDAGWSHGSARFLPRKQPVRGFPPA